MRATITFDCSSSFDVDTDPIQLSSVGRSALVFEHSLSVLSRHARPDAASWVELMKPHWTAALVTMSLLLLSAGQPHARQADLYVEITPPISSANGNQTV